MTDQRDPNDPRRDYIRRGEGSYSVGAIVGALALVFVLALLLFSFTGDRTGDPVTPRSPGANAPTTTTPPAATPPATTPRQQ